MQVFPYRVRSIWKEWDLRAFILTSLCLQIVLIFSGSLRKCNKSRCISLILWSAYLLADWVATFALGILSNNQGSPSGPHIENNNLLVFWAPFLLLHLGGPDTITAFSLEDNELWMRHLLGLMFQVGVAIYVFIGSLPQTRLKAPAALMFLAGILKYGERSWALMCASMDNLRNSMVTPPDPGPNYAMFMEEYASMSAAGLQAEIEVEKEPETQPRARSLDTDAKEISTKEILSNAHRFFHTFKRLIVDLILTFHDRNESRSFFLQLRDPLQAFKVIEIELSFIYEVLYTKSTVIHTVVGPFLRGITFFSILSALLLFLFTKKHGYTDIDIAITYILLGGALVLESYAVGLLVFSEWAFLKLKDLKQYRLSNMIFASISFFRPTNRPRWSDAMAQHNLISFCLEDQPSTIKSVMDFLSVKEAWDRFHHTTYCHVDEDLKIFIFKEIKEKSSSAEDSKGYKRFSTCRGEWALQKKGYQDKLGWSVEVEFDESILLWHIATDLCSYSDGTSQPENKCSDQNISKAEAISDYMLYLLVVRPFMLTAGIGQIRYGDTCAEAKKFFQRGEGMPNKEEACKMLRFVETKVPPIQVKGDRSKSVLFDACMLANALLELKVEKRWKIMSAVWVEMLCYAASHCRGYYHAKQLSAGGELLTLVWFVMAHLGIGEQYRIEEGHARAKLIVEI
ncbi:1-phosphatidylinositol 4,5-bisphosphate phosphodiesterase beta-1 [Cocos nucifera]|uniref:1-phosphatidylinositol 4,5-bisphosphate phosphodiesterase beta-1 n=1 Tax=Cocos nucifera TaxID=13894 RepID=A0A8K0IC04_COCNU|nr:1-phosphatidylinositol 4,5-bisphosphate phosphodiesterase beta-1 [Cocos nucifera]